MSNDYEMLPLLVVTRRCYDQLKRVAELKGRSVEDLCEAAIEDATILSEREYPPPGEGARSLQRKRYRDGNVS